MRNDKIQKLVWAGLFTALTTIATMIVQVPSPLGGYLNAGDAVVILSAFLLGSPWGALAAGLGSALAAALLALLLLHLDDTYAFMMFFLVAAIVALLVGLPRVTVWSRSRQ